MASPDPDSGSPAEADSEPAVPALLDLPTPLASWLAAAFRSFSLRELVVVTALVGGVPFAVSVAIAFGAGFGVRFLTTGSVHLWTAGLFGGGLTVGWWAKRYPELWRRLRPVFDVPAAEYRGVVRPRIAAVYDLRRPLPWVTAVLAVGAVYDAVSVAPLVIDVRGAAPSPADPGLSVCLPLDWCVAWLAAINYTYGVVSVAGLVVAVHVIVGHLRLVDDVMELPLRDARTAAADLAPLARFNVVVSAGWFVSLAFGTVLLIAGRYDPWTDPVYLSTFLFLFLLGFVLFAVPQLSIHDGIQAEKRRILNDIGSEYERIHGDISSRDGVDSPDAVSVRLEALEARRRSVAGIRTWAYDLPGLVSLALSSVLPLLLQFGQTVA